MVEFYILAETTLKLDVRGTLALSTLISRIWIRKLLSKRAQGYLTFLVNIPEDKIKLEDVPVINEYLDIFPDELVSLSLERKIEFKIDLVSETTHISKTLYRMAPTEFMKLKL